MTVGYELAGKRRELLREMTQGASRVAVLSNPDNPTYIPFLHDTEHAATTLGLELRAFEARGPGDLPGAFAAMADWHSSGMVSLSDAMLFTQRNRLAELALRSKLPPVFPEAEFAAAGGLASYGPSLPDLFRRAAGYVENILKGAKPADLPTVELTRC